MRQRVITAVVALAIFIPILYIGGIAVVLAAPLVRPKRLPQKLQEHLQSSKLQVLSCEKAHTLLFLPKLLPLIRLQYLKVFLQFLGQSFWSYQRSVGCHF
jgi:hypothetical protein